MTMDNKINVSAYLNTIHTPWSQLFYKVVWHNLTYRKKTILDFGSGFGITADHLAQNNAVTAIEPNEALIGHRVCNNNYRQIVGSIGKLKEIPDNAYDVVVCHNVLEYMKDRVKLFDEFHRILKEGGTISLVKHNKLGKVMQKAVFEYNIEEALTLINNGNIISDTFGEIDEYTNAELEKYVEGHFHIKKVYGVRMFFGLQRNEIKAENDWMTKMLELECAAEEIPAFRDIAFFHHIILSKN